MKPVRLKALTTLFNPDEADLSERQVLFPKEEQPYKVENQDGETHWYREKEVRRDTGSAAGGGGGGEGGAGGGMGRACQQGPGKRCPRSGESRRIADLEVNARVWRLSTGGRRNRRRSRAGGSGAAFGRARTGREGEEAGREGPI